MANDENIFSSWKMLQIGMVIKDMDQAVKRLSELGFGPFIPKNLPRSTKPGQKGEPIQGEVDVQRATLGNVELELCQPVSGQSPHREFLDGKGEGIHHIMFAVPDLDAELDRFIKLGAKILMHLTFNGGGIAYVDLNACGLILELIQLPENDPETLKTVLSR
ncbi:MAG: VOC family protein [Dehalococcoidales bacterium]|nr:VOC family protein [Dehalococcoidales bacterium]